MSQRNMTAWRMGTDCVHKTARGHRHQAPSPISWRLRHDRRPTLRPCTSQRAGQTGSMVKRSCGRERLALRSRSNRRGVRPIFTRILLYQYKCLRTVRGILFRIPFAVSICSFTICPIALMSCNRMACANFWRSCVSVVRSCTYATVFGRVRA